MSWLNYLISKNNSSPPQGRQCQLNPIGALHSLPKTSGLFNTGLKGITDSLDPLPLGVEDSTCVVPSTPTGFDDLDLFPENMSVEAMLSMKEAPGFDILTDAETEGMGLGSLDHFQMENFIDIKDILEIKPVIDFGESSLNTPEILNEYIDFKPSLFSQEKVKESRKRKATESPDHDYASKSPEKPKVILSIKEPKRKRRMTRKSYDNQSESSTPAAMETSNVSPRPSCSSVSEFETDLESVCSESFNGLTHLPKKDQRRIKNNFASKRSREIRKNKFKNMEGEVVVLEKENEALRLKIEQMESLAKRMKDLLVARLAACKK